MSSAHSPSFPSLHLCHSSFSNPSIILPTSQLILQPSIILPTSQLILQPYPSLYLLHSSFSNPSVASPTSLLILQPFHHFTYVTTHSPTLSAALPTSQIIVQLFFRFSYVTSSSLNSPGEPSKRIEPGSLHRKAGASLTTSAMPTLYCLLSQKKKKQENK